MNDVSSQSRTFPATMDAFPDMNAFLEEQSLRVGMPGALVNKILLAAEEALTNVIHYAYQGRAGELTIVCEALPGRPGLRLRIEDDGVAFNPLDRADPDTTLPLEQRRIGGLGIYMMKQIMDEVRYERRGDRNVLTLTKYLPAP